MTPFKLFSFLSICLLTVTTTALCQVQKQKKPPIVEGVLTSRQSFWNNLPKPVGYINDFENIYTDREKKVLDSLTRDFENRTTIQIAVISIDTIMTTADSLDALTLRMANAWGVEQKDKNNGVVIGISKGHQRIRIHNGYGIEKVLSDIETKQIIDTGFIPGFRAANYFQGTYNGLLALMNILEQRYQ